MSRELLSSEKGFTYLAALFIMMIMGIMLGMIGETWSMIMRRDREEELLFRGKQIKTAIQRYRDNDTKFGKAVGGIKGIEDLLKDNRTPTTVRYLRKNWPDPITGEEWKTVTEPGSGIVGVYSPSDQQPLKKANFPLEFKDFEKKEKYSDWKFVYKSQQQLQQLQQQQQQQRQQQQQQQQQQRTR